MLSDNSDQMSPDNVTTVGNHVFNVRKDSVAHTILVAFVVSLICSVLVSTSVILLRPRQLENQLIHSGHRNVIQLIESIEKTGNVEEILARIDTRLIDLATGEYVTDIDVSQFKPREAASDPSLSVVIPPDLDIAMIERRARFATVNLVKENNRIKYIVLPVYGSGMWSTLYGYIALEADGNTIAGLKIYEHAETPGIGDKVDNPAWLGKWQGKHIYQEDGTPAIEIVKGKVAAETQYQVDALTGATKTGEGVTKLLRYWFGNHGFQPYLKKLRNKEGETYDR